MDIKRAEKFRTLRVGVPCTHTHTHAHVFTVYACVRAFVFILVRFRDFRDAVKVQKYFYFFHKTFFGKLLTSFSRHTCFSSTGATLEQPTLRTEVYFKTITISCHPARAVSNVSMRIERGPGENFGYEKSLATRPQTAELPARNGGRLRFRRPERIYLETAAYALSRPVRRGKNSSTAAVGRHTQRNRILSRPPPPPPPLSQGFGSVFFSSRAEAEGRN